MKAGVWILVALTFAAGALAQAPQERPDWKLFSRIRRSMERLSLRTSVLARCWLTMWNVHRNGSCPASTFKVPHALFALDAGAVRDEFQVIRWDGVKRDFDGWNQDPLRSSMRHSTVWVYQQFAREIGEVREKNI